MAITVELVDLHSGVYAFQTTKKKAYTQFKISINGNLKNGRVQWWERTDKPYTALEAAGNYNKAGWTDLFLAYRGLDNGDSNMFSDVYDAINGEKDEEQKLFIEDKPEIDLDKTDKRNLEFIIGVQEEDNKGIMHYAYMKQKIECEDNKVKISFYATNFIEMDTVIEPNNDFVNKIKCEDYKYTIICENEYKISDIIDTSD